MTFLQEIQSFTLALWKYIVHCCEPFDGIVMCVILVLSALLFVTLIHQVLMLVYIIGTGIANYVYNYKYKKRMQRIYKVCGKWQ